MTYVLYSYSTAIFKSIPSQITQMTILHGRRLFLPSHNFSFFYKLAPRSSHTHPWLLNRMGHSYFPSIPIHARERSYEAKTKQPTWASPQSPDGIRETNVESSCRTLFSLLIEFSRWGFFSTNLLSSEAYKSESHFFCVDVVRK